MTCECHAHIFMNGIDYRRAVSEHRNGPDMDRIREHLAAYRDAGITYVRDGGDRYGASEAAREIAGEYGITYRTPTFGIHRKGHYGSIVGRAAETLREVHELVLEAKRRRADFIKIMISGLIGYDTYGTLSEPGLEPDWIREMIHIAHEEGLAVMAHANGRETVLAALEAGVDSVEHGNYIGEECIRAMAESDCVWVPTIVTTKNLLGCDRYYQETIQRTLHQIYEMECEQLISAFVKGVSIAVGSDAGAYLVPHGRGAGQEEEIFLDVLTKEGHTREEITDRIRQGEEQIREKFKRHI